MQLEPPGEVRRDAQRELRSDDPRPRPGRRPRDRLQERRHGHRAARCAIAANLGAYFQLLTPVIPTLTVLMAPAATKSRTLDIECIAVFTNTMSTDAYRGAGRPEATFCIERAMDLVARGSGLDPADVRRKNFIEGRSFRITTATGLTYDSGDYDTTHGQSARAGRLRRLAAETSRGAAKPGRYIGIGLSTYVEVCGMGPSKAMPARRLGFGDGARRADRRASPC